MKLEDVRLWGTVDPDLVAAPGKQTCRHSHCTLLPDHEGPHLDAHPASGRIFGIWFNNEDKFVSPDDVSNEVVKVVMELNRLRDDAVEAVEEVLGYKARVQAKYVGTTDEHMKALLMETSLFPHSEHDITYSGTEADSKPGIREELLDILGLNQEEEW